MSLSNIKTYFRGRLDGLGYAEWRDGFAFNNIPETILDKSYHILVESIGGGAINHTHQNTDARVRINIFFMGHRDVSEAIDTAIAGVETILRDVLKVANRTSLVNNVIYTDCIIKPLNDSNDNSVFVEMLFNVRVILGVEE